MSTEQNTCRSRVLSKLPPELAHLILCQVPDAPTLRNLLLTAPSFYHSFFATPGLILKAVLINESGLRLLPDALATSQASHLSEAGFDNSREELLSAMQNVPQIPEAWSMADSLALSKIHSHVDYFASKFASNFTQPPEEVIPIDEEPATPTEMQRIRTALFRFELFCNLYRKSPNLPEWKQKRPSWSERKKSFLDKFSPWENEQMFTMYEYLRKLVTLAFNDVAEHDVLWGKHNIGFSPNHKEHYVSLGLAWLHKLAIASTYDERYQLLAPETGEQDPDFMTKTIAGAHDEVSSIQLPEVTEHTILNYVRPSFSYEPDRGPFTAWWWAYKEEFDYHMYASLDLKTLRSTGFIMFDYDRIQRRDLLEILFLPYIGLQEENDARVRRRQKMYRSRCKRSEIYDRGGRGYWSEDDESKLIWGCSRPQEGIELTLPGWGYLDTWEKGVLVDRERWDTYDARN